MATGVKYTEEQIEPIFNSIISEIANTGAATKHAVTTKGIGLETFYIWLDSSDNRAKRYARALNTRTETLEQLLICASLGDGQDIITRPDGVQVTQWHVIQRDRLISDTYKFLMMKLFPKKYGEKLDITSGGEAVQHGTLIDFAKLSDQTIEMIKKDLSK
jgi:hypothetical protein